MNIEQKIRQWIEDQLQGSEIFLVDLKIGAGKILVTLDGDQLVPLKKCVELNRLLGNYLEEQDLIETAYTLEVGSPGADAMMKNRRQFPKHIGRTLSFHLKDGSRREGVLKDVEEDTALLIEETMKEKGKKPESIERRISFQDLNEAQVLLNFKNIKGGKKDIRN